MATKRVAIRGCPGACPRQAWAWHLTVFFPRDLLRTAGQASSGTHFKTRFNGDAVPRQNLGPSQRDAEAHFGWNRDLSRDTCRPAARSSPPWPTRQPARPTRTRACVRDGTRPRSAARFSYGCLRMLSGDASSRRSPSSFPRAWASSSTGTMNSRATSSLLFSSLTYCSATVCWVDPASASSSRGASSA
jgi:hypothetical protein